MRFRAEAAQEAGQRVCQDGEAARGSRILILVVFFSTAAGGRCRRRALVWQVREPAKMASLPPAQGAVLGVCVA